MNVLIIGGNRFVGRYLVWRLLAQNHRPTVLNRGRVGDPFGGRVERLVGDRTGPDLERLLAGRSFDAVVDMAAYTGEDGRRAAELLQRRTGHYIMVSTGQVYLVREGCPRPMRVPAREDDYDGPVMSRPGDSADVGDWEYGVGKRECEDALTEAVRAGFPATRIRLPMVNGPLDYFRRIEAYLWRLVDGGPVILPDGGTQWVRHVDGAQVARFLCDILGKQVTFGRAYNVAQQEMPTLAELVSELRELVGSRAEISAVSSDRIRAAGLRPIEVSPFDDPWMSLLDPTRAIDELGFSHPPMARSLGAITSSFLAHTPGDRPAGYAGRDIERRLASVP